MGKWIRFFAQKRAAGNARAANFRNVGGYRKDKSGKKSANEEE